MDYQKVVAALLPLFIHSDHFQAQNAFFVSFSRKMFMMTPVEVNVHTLVIIHIKDVEDD